MVSQVSFSYTSSSYSPFLKKNSSTSNSLFSLFSVLIPSFIRASTSTFKAKKISSLTKEEITDWRITSQSLLKELQHTLQQPTSKLIRQEWQKLFSTLSTENLTSFFQLFLSQDFSNLDHAEFEKLSDSFLDLVNLDTLAKAIEHKFSDQTFDLSSRIEQLKTLLSQQTMPAKNLIDEQKKERKSNVVTRFLPNLVYIFLRAFNLFDTARPPDSLYEYGVLVTLYMNFFAIVVGLIEVLSKFILAPLPLVLITALIITSLTSLLYLYLRFLKKCPDEVVYCENLSKKSNQGKLETVLCREREYVEAMNYLSNGKQRTATSLMIIGKPGVGKTSWMNGLANKMPHLRFFFFKNWVLFGAGSPVMSAAEKIDLAFQEVYTYEHQVVFCLDELGDAFKNNPADLVSVLKPWLNRKEIQLVASMTAEQWKALQQQDQALTERFKPLFFDSPTDQQVEMILKEKLCSCTPSITALPGSLKKIIEKSNQDEKYCQPRKALAKLDELINRIQQFDPTTYISSDLIQAQEELKYLKDQTVTASLHNPFSKETTDYFKQLNQQEEKIKELQAQDEKHRTGAIKVRELTKRIFHYEQQRSRINSQLNQAKLIPRKKKSLTKNFFFTYFFALSFLYRQVTEISKDLPSDIVLQIDEKAINEIFKEVKSG